MLDVHTPVSIKYWYYLIVMILFYSLPTLDSVKLVNNQISLPTQASSNTTALPTLRPSFYIAPIFSLPPTIISTTSSPIVATSSPPTVTLSSSPTLSSTVTFPPIEGSRCSDTCGSERELVDNSNMKGQIIKYIDVGKMKEIDCLDTSKITNMNYLLNGYSDNRFRSFNTDLSCRVVSSVTSMNVST